MKRGERRPFPAGGVVSSVDLVGRESAVQALVQRVYAQKSSVYVSGPRQVGKTSVVTETLARVRKQGGRAIYLDCSGAVDLAGFATALAAATYDEKAKSAGAFARLRDSLSGVRPTVMHPDSGLVMTFFGGEPQPAASRLERALALADELAVADEKQTVVVFDEFPRLADLDAHIFNQIRAQLQHSTKNTAYVFMGSQVGMLQTLFTQRKNMLYRLASSFDLPAPLDAEWIRYIEQRFASWKKTLGTGEAARMLTLTGGHPRDLMELCRSLLEIRLATPAKGPADLDLAFEQTLAGLDASFDQLWQSLLEPTGTRVTALRIANNKPIWPGRPRKTVQRTLDRLERDGLVRHLEGRGRYEFTQKLFAVWLQRQPARGGAV